MDMSSIRILIFAIFSVVCGQNFSDETSFSTAVHPHQHQQEQPKLSVALALLREPDSQDARSDSEVTLNCQFNGPASECMWLKDNQVTIVKGPYQFKGVPSTGDCSLYIAHTNPDRDDGVWQCQYPRVDGNPGLNSRKAKLTVLVPPQNPEIFYQGSSLSMGEVLRLETVGENMSLMCVSRRGNPAANLYWMIEGRRLEGVQSNLTDEPHTDQQLFSIRNDLNLVVSHELQGKVIRCIAEHPAYHSQLHESYINLEVHHNTTSVAVYTDRAFGKGFGINIEIEENQYVTLYCIADGVPQPSYRWEFKRIGENDWENWSTEQNLTIAAMAGKFMCSARNEYNVESVKSPEEITLETTAPKANGGGSIEFCLHSLLTLTFVTLLNLVKFC